MASEYKEPDISNYHQRPALTDWYTRSHGYLDKKANAQTTQNYHVAVSGVKKQKVADDDSYCSSPDSGIEVCDAINLLLPLVKDRYKFGICANIEPSELDMIMDRYADPVQCLSNIVDRWNRTNCSQSWTALAKVVEKMQNYNHVVLSLRKMAGDSTEYRDSVVTRPSNFKSEAVQKRNTIGNVEVRMETASYSNSKSLPQGYLRFKCAGDECTIKDHFEGKKKCTKHSNRYPYLEFQGEGYETDIEIYLEEQTDMMRESFASLMLDTKKRLRESITTTFSDIQGYVKLLVAGKIGYDMIKNANDLCELQDALIETCCSWFNHGIIAKIRKAFLHKNDNDYLIEKYTQDFEEYCKRRCFESPITLHPEIDSSKETGTQSLVFKVEQDFHTSTLTDILQVKRAVAKILGCPPHAINVCTVKEGCVEVHCCLLPIAVISSLTIKQVINLKQQGIISVKVEGEELLPRKKKEIVNEPLPIETILELSQSPTNHNRKVFTFTFPQPQLPTTTRTLYSASTESRHKVISKIVDAERKYLRHLQVLLSGYLPAMKEVTTPRDLRMLFPAQLEPMMERHEDMLSQLEARMEGHTPTVVGDIFASFFDAEFLTMYGAYLKEFKVAVKMLAKCKQSSPEFCEQLSMCQHSFFCEGLSLASYLLTPVQRLPRYELLLKELLKHTPGQHADNHLIVDAVDKLHKGLIRLNRSIKLCLLACSVREVQNQKSLRGTRKLTNQMNTTGTIDGEPSDEQDDQDDQEEATKKREREGDGVREEEEKYKRKGSLQSTSSSKPSTLYSSTLARNASNLSTPNREDWPWLRSWLSIHSNASGTSGYGSVSTNQSRLDLTIHPMTPPTERNSKLSFSSSRSVPSSIRGRVFRSNLQNEAVEDESLGGRSATVGRNMSWTTSRMNKKCYISTTDLLELSVNGPSLYWSEESIEAAMRWEEGMDGHCIEGRSAVSCSDLLLSLRLCSNGRKDHTHLAPPSSKSRQHKLQQLHVSDDLAGPSRADGEVKRSLSRLSLLSNSSTATSGFNSVTHSQLDLTEEEPITVKQLLVTSHRLSSSMPNLSLTPHLGQLNSYPVPRHVAVRNSDPLIF